MANRILEIGGLAAGFCGRLFRHAGADVVRVDSPTMETDAADPAVIATDAAQAADAWVSDAALDAFLHAGKRRIASRDPDLIRELAGNADILIAEGTPASLDALGFAALTNPPVRVAITPFGLTGPLKDWQASASVLLAMGGYTFIMGDPGRPPLTLPGHYVQYQSGQHAYIAANALALEGDPDQLADVSMWETVLSLSQFTTIMWTAKREIRKRHGSDFGLLTPIDLFPCADGWFHVNVVPAFWDPFTCMLDRPELAADPRFVDNAARRENIEALNAIIIEQLGSKTRAEVMRLGEEARVPTGILQTLPEVIADPHLAERAFFESIDALKVARPAYRFMSS